MSEDFCRVQARQLLTQVKAIEPPVDVEAIAASLGLALTRVNRGRGFEGRLLRERLTIEVERSTHPHKQRFTVAHEIGHFILGHNPILGIADDRARSDPTRINDRQANVFASELLMPEEWIRSHWRKIRNCSEMAKLFFVSQEAMFYRLEDLNLLGLEPRL